MNPTVLLVDDDEGIRDALADLLAYAGWTVIPAGDGLEALAWLQSNPSPSVILLDLKMPRCDGYAFRTRLLADGRLRAVPTVVFSADARFEAAPGSSLAGLPIVRKSAEPAELLATLAAASGQAPRPR